MPAKTKKIGLIVGSGDLAVRAADAAPNAPVVCLEGAANPSHFQSHPFITARVGSVGRTLSFFKAQGCDSLVFVGGLTRPTFWNLWPDITAIRALFMCGYAYLFGGDDSLLRAVRHFVERQGFDVCGVDHLVTDLTWTRGHHVGQDNLITERHIASGFEALRSHAQQDRGQALLLHPDGAVDFEGKSGTAHLIDSYARKGSVLFKMMKPQQDPDLDRPVIGLATAQKLQAKGGVGIVIEANTVFVLDQLELKAYADKHQMFVRAV